MTDENRRLFTQAFDREELDGLILQLGNIASPYREERQVAEFVYDWMAENGFSPRKVAFSEDRPNVVGVLPGTGGGMDLVFNSHMDTAVSPADPLIHKNPQDPFFHSAWMENDCFMGEGVHNDKGPLACFLMAAKTIRKAGIQLPGDVILTAVCGETGLEPVDEFQGPRYHSKDFSTRYLLTHGGVAADVALVAEGTDFGAATMEAGKAFFKITVFGEIVYTPWVRREPGIQSPNVFVRTARLIGALEDWARDYEQRNVLHTPEGTVEPKVQISALRGGQPYYVTKGAEACMLYLDVRLTPDQDPRGPRDELKDLLQQTGLQGEVELFLHRRGYRSQNLQPAMEALGRAHQEVLGTQMQTARPGFSSMWRDNNPFNEMNIPAVTYGPTRRCPIHRDDMYRAALVYGLTAIDVCSRKRHKR